MSFIKFDPDDNFYFHHGMSKRVAETGLGFSKYLNSLRLQHAEQLLRTTPKPNITKIAESCGFEDSNYFSKKFKEKYGVSPKRMDIGKKI